jgi:radical SAM protein with 4Fe4S-binding SPASM domain
MLSGIKKIAFRIFKESEIKLHELNYLFWECTTRCNLNCLHCGSDCLKDGSISACPNIDRTWTQGNIYQDHFYNTWNTKYEPFRNRNWAKIGKCASCSEFRDCQGNGFHNWHGDMKNVLVCHNELLIKAMIQN